MSWDCILQWVEQHPGWAAWVQAVGSVVALVFAVWLPAHARAVERGQAIDGRKALLIVLLTELEAAVTDNGPADPAALDDALTASLQKLDIFLAGETNLEIAREVLVIRPEIKSLLKIVGTGYLDPMWDAYRSDFLKMVYEVTIRIVNDSPHLLPKPTKG